MAVEVLAEDFLNDESGGDLETAPMAHLWLPAAALNCNESDPKLRSWLKEPGLLTKRMRAELGSRFHLRVAGEKLEGTEHVREVELCAGERPWIFAHTRVPQATLADHSWILELGNTGLGESLESRSGVRRTEFAYARLPADVPLVARALERAGLSPQPLWVRRSRFFVEGAPLVVQEVFFPHTGSTD